MTFPLIRTLLLGILLLPAIDVSAQKVTFRAIGMDGISKEMGLRQIEIFRNDTLAAWNYPSHKGIWSTHLDKPGKYKAWYATVGNRYIPIDLSQVKRDTVILLPMTASPDDSLMDIPFIDQLKEGQTLVIEYRSQGCFHYVDQQLRINRKGNHYGGVWKDESFELSTAQVDSVRQFEVGLGSKVLPSGCTTQDRYIIRVEGNEALGKLYEDGSCEFNGYRNLLEALGKSLW